jgi:hypothetical protein
MNEARWPVMEYKVYFIDALWSPKNGLAIRLWKEDVA